jgi:UPF0271 protein
VTSIDVNCDLGEIPELVRDGTDDRLMACVSSANAACGGHAGDAASMELTVRSALRHGVAVGAHPSYPDRANFGRRAMDVRPEAVEAFVFDQVGALAAIAARLGVALAHLKPHGALYHAATRDRAIAEAIGRAAARVDPRLVLVGLAGSPVLATWHAMGRAVAGEAFADRLYEADGRLRPRTQAGAVIEEPERAALQALRIATGQGVVAARGTVVPVEARTICVHGDTRGAVAIARAVRGALDAAGIRVMALR